jgi:hypothetical protein
MPPVQLLHGEQHFISRRHQCREPQAGQASPVQSVMTAWQRTLRRPIRGLVPLAECRMRWLRTCPALPTGPQHGT